MKAIALHKSRLQLITDLAQREKLTIRQLYLRIAGARGHRTIIGTPEQITDKLEEWFINGGALLIKENNDKILCDEEYEIALKYLH